MREDAKQHLTTRPPLQVGGSSPARVLVVSDIRIVREGLVSALSKRQMSWEVSQSSGLEEAVARASRGAVDVALADMSILGGQEPTERLAQLARSTRVIAFAAANSDTVLLACVECGIVGFVPRDGSADDLVATVEGALRGEASLSPRLTVSLMRRLAAVGRGIGIPRAVLRLTRRERQILALIDEGLGNKEIAGRLLIELATVKNHVHSILEKTQARRRGEAAALIRRAPR